RHPDGIEPGECRGSAQGLGAGPGGRDGEDARGMNDRTDGFRFPVLIGDICGTNARFAVVADAGSEAGESRIVKTADYPTIDEAIAATVLARGERPRSAVLAVAGPVNGDEIALTNCPWVVRPRGLFSSVGLEDVVV